MPQHASCYHTGYALTCEEYDALLAINPGRCHFCGLATTTFCIDHDHMLGKWAVRGLLCQSCNQYMRQVDSGRAPAQGAAKNYTDRAWHLDIDSAAKAARVRPRALCPICGLDSAVNNDGSVRRHWSRLPGMHETRCPPINSPKE